jgi:HD superfamily phosphodiesterase
MKQVEDYALQFLSQGRKDWDIPHTRAVVGHIHDITKSENQDVLVLETAAWLHDIGYFGLFDDRDSKQNDVIETRKDLHMEKGAEFARAFLDKPEIDTFYTQTQKDRIIHLIRIHDKLEQLKDLDEIILMEADTLGQIDVEHVPPTFDYDNAMSWYTSTVEKKRAPKFRTQLGKEKLNILLPKFLDYFRK